MLGMERERRRRGMSRRALGEAIGVTEEAIRLMETGKRKPSYDKLVKLEDLFECSHRKLFAPEEPTEK